jgi:hypothetical protein
MKSRYAVLRWDYGGEWDHATEVEGIDAEDAAETFAEEQCVDDPERYSVYERGVLLDVKDLATNEVSEVEVTMHSNPTFTATQRR